MAAIPSTLSAEQETLTMGFGADPCPVPDCPISAQEHHRLARGIMAENTELKRQLAALNGHTNVPTPEQCKGFVPMHGFGKARMCRCGRDYADHPVRAQ